MVYQETKTRERLIPYRPEVKIFPNSEALDWAAANFVAEQLSAKPNSVLLLPTGSTPKEMYVHLVRLYQKGAVDFSQVFIFSLDEYWPIPFDHPNFASSFYTYMRGNLITQVNIQPDHFKIPCCHAPNPEEEAQKYEQTLQQAGGVDLAILGIGGNGHIGFNEPGTPFNRRTQVVDLDEETRAHNRQYFVRPEAMPEKAITVGPANIMEAKRVLLLAKGERKASPISLAIEGPITPQCPASILQRHPQATVFLDQEASMLLENSTSL